MNRRPLDLQSNALPLSYTPSHPSVNHPAAAAASLLCVFSERLDSLEEQVRQRTLEADRLRATLQEERTRKTQLETVIQEGVIILRHVLAVKKTNTV